MHNASKILMGTTRSSFKIVDNFKGTIVAGYAVRLKSDGTLSSALADGSLMGISLGKSASGIARTCVCRKGEQVPIKLKSGFSNPAKGAQVAIDDTTGEAVAYTGSGNSYVNAYYGDAGVITGVQEDGTEISVALIDFVGGL